MYPRLIPSILIQDGRLVKGVRFDGYKDAGAPATTARAHNHQSADELVVCDISASGRDMEPDFQTLQKVADECFMPLTIYGNINTPARAARCMEIGADKIGLTAPALDNPKLITDLAHIYGAQAIVLGLDVIETEPGVYAVFDHRTGEPVPDKTPAAWAKEAADRGCGEIHIMAVSCEGGLGGFDMRLYEAIKGAVSVPLILEGGAGSLDDIEQAYKAGVQAIGLGSMLVFSDANLVKIKQHMRSRGIPMRV